MLIYQRYAIFARTQNLQGSPILEPSIHSLEIVIVMLVLIFGSCCVSISVSISVSVSASASVSTSVSVFGSSLGRVMRSK